MSVYLRVGVEMAEQTEPIQDAEDFSVSTLEAMLVHLCALREEAADQKKAYDTGSKPVRDYLDKHPGEQLRDGEGRVAAWLQNSRPEKMLDIRGLAEKHPKLVVIMADMGLLKMDFPAFEAAEGKFPGYTDVLGFIGQGKSKRASLRIERDKR